MDGMSKVETESGDFPLKDQGKQWWFYWNRYHEYCCELTGMQLRWNPGLHWKGK